MPRINDAATTSPSRRFDARIGREPVIARELFRPGPLRDDFARLSHPAAPMADADILSLLLKFFYASLYPGSEAHAVPLPEICTQLGRFYDLWSQEGPDGAVPLAGEYSAFSLRMLTDLPRTAHIFRSVANRPLPPSQVQDPFLGFDCGTGTGVLLAAAWFQAKRNGVAETRLFGIDIDPEIAARTRLLFDSLGLGEVRVADARESAAYAGLPDGPVAFVANENVAAPTARLSAEPFSAIHATLFDTFSKRLKSTVFFPEALVVRDRDREMDVVLSKNNRFQLPRHYRHLRPRPRSIVIEGRLTRLWQVGRDFHKYLSESWLPAMPGRW
ncbi:class I SAM-dependent methyltransferase [Solidesulfovibrio sp.]|uniref:class I SAM-dependent methyltransferase n=1 Tax=Solidesulfovibrio sp. TaxID=2910990 RepID=UPI002615D85F|nr:class I SAM-dependent methyltransferase [Solidesulfovibrio sp.]